jgi:predicted RNA-binding protein with TRAM domain
MVYQYVAIGGLIAAGAIREYLKQDEDESEQGSEEDSEDEAEQHPEESRVGQSNETSSKGDESRKEAYSAGVRESRIAHKQAGQRKAPVDLGKAYEIFIEEEEEHHTGERVLKGEYESFVLFVYGPPDDVEVGDVTTVRVTSFNTGGTSADAKVVGS